MRFSTLRLLASFLAAAFSSCFIDGCATAPGRHEARKGDEIVVAGQMFHTGTPVVLWMDPGGYDAYRVERRFSPFDEADWQHSKDKLRSPNRYGLRQHGLSDEEIERVRGGGWDLPTLQRVVDQFVLHFDVCGTSRTCFKVLQDSRDLSVHFMLDIDGTIYQTLDLKERAWHATTSNDRSVGVEIANMGSYGAAEKDPLAKWYRTDPHGPTVITVPTNYGPNPVRTPDFSGKPARRAMVEGTIQGESQRQYDYTPQQYHALAKLTAALCAVFPKINCDYPRDEHGKLLPKKLPDDQLQAYHGVLGHYHIQTNKTDPGPALQWDYVVGEARRLLKKPTLPYNAEGQTIAFRPKLIVDN
ncbi:MAG TPA: peptidoglycan recognition family protein [Verrucomicrobiae bacterium]|jgi:N-acetyl-anhydromuramyl-L-alanine amidase AmpD|nr:peptidoglycan recognition family protein [Verrucomicrobiae bacterium]